MRGIVHASIALAGFYLFAADEVRAAPPQVSALFPAGVERGTEVAVQVVGSAAPWPPVVWCSRDDVACAPQEEGRLLVSAPAEAPPGLCWIRLSNAEGSATPRPFVVGHLRESPESEPNNDLATAQVAAETTLVLNGRFSPRGEVDVFRVELPPGAVLVAALDSHELLGSPADAVLQVLDDSGAVLQQANDDRGLDPLCVFASAPGGTYYVRAFCFSSTADSAIGFAGGDDFVYRLTLTTGPYVDAAFPSAVAAAGTTQVLLGGWNLPAELSEFACLGPPAVGPWTLFVSQAAGRIEAIAGDSSGLVSAHGTLADPQRVTLPCTITGCLEQPAAQDVFGFSALGGQPLELTVESRQLGYPLDGVLQIRSAAGELLAEADDVGELPDPQTTFTPAADGDYLAVLRDRFAHGGPRFVYRLQMGPAAPDFSLQTDAHSWTVASGQTVEIPLTVQRRHGLTEDVWIEAIQLPPGFTAEQCISHAGDDSAGQVVLRLAAGAQAQAGPVRIVGQAADSKLLRPVQVRLPEFRQPIADFWLTPVPAPAP